MLSTGTLDYGPAEIDANDCIKWDQFFITTRMKLSFLMLGTYVLMTLIVMQLNIQIIKFQKVF